MLGEEQENKLKASEAKDSFSYALLLLFHLLWHCSTDAKASITKRNCLHEHKIEPIQTPQVYRQTSR